MDITDWIPWLLILFAVPADAPDGVQVIKVEIVADEEDCLMQGSDYIEAQEPTDASAGQSLSFACTAIPDRSSFSNAVQRWIEKQARAQQPE